jgi:hypothetical protein
MIDVPHHLALCITSKKYHANHQQVNPSASLFYLMAHRNRQDRQIFAIGILQRLDAGQVVPGALSCWHRTRELVGL